MVVISNKPVFINDKLLSSKIMSTKGAFADAAATCTLCETLIIFCDDDDSNMKEMHKKYKSKMVCLYM